MDFIDQMNRTIRLEQKPKRIVSLVPSQTELLYDLGLEDEVVGITKFCIHPATWFNAKTRVGGTKNINIQKVAALKPDLIIGNKEENTKEDIELLEKIAPVWISDIIKLQDAIEMIVLLGNLVGKLEKAMVFSDVIKESFEALEKQGFQRKRTLYLIWRKPYLLAGKETFIDDVMSTSGFENCCKLSRYPELIFNENLNPELILLSSEPYPFKERHFSELQVQFPDAKVMLVDGEMFSWYGSHLTHAAKYITDLRKNIDNPSN